MRRSSLRLLPGSSEIIGRAWSSPFRRQNSSRPWRAWTLPASGWPTNSTRNFGTRRAYLLSHPDDVRYVLQDNHRAYGDFLRPDLQEVWGTNNLGL